MFSIVKVHIKSYINRKGILLIFFSVLASHASSQGYNFRNFNSENGLAKSFIYSIIQDVHGYLWIGTDKGLLRYNGFKFDKYSTSDSLTDNYITCGISDAESLWFGHKNGGLSYFNGKKFSPVKIPQPVLSQITHFAKNPDGSIWAATYSDGLLKFGKGSDMVKYKLLKDHVYILSFDFLNAGELLIGTNSGLLFCRLRGSDKVEIIRNVAEIPESKVIGILKMRNNSGYYIATENDIFQLTYENNRIKVSKIITEPALDISGIQDICEDSQSDLWVCSFGSGLIKLIHPASGEFTKIIYFNDSNGFATENGASIINVKTVFEDREGNIWSGNFGEGLTQITPKTFSVIKFDNPLYGNNIFSIWSDKQFRWIGTENGLVKIDQVTGKNVKFYGKDSGLPKDTVTSIYSANGQVLWIGTEKNGVFRMEAENDRILKYTIGNGTLENSVNIITGKGERVWIGTKKGLCSINSSTDSIKWYTINKGGLPHNVINCLYLDRTDKLWIGTPRSTLAYIKDEKVFKTNFNSGNGILTITEDKDSRIWVGSNGNGVFQVKSDSIANITAREGLLSNYCYSIVCDDQNNIWIGHKVGLSRIRIADFSVKPVRHIEGITDNWQFNPNAIIKDQQGKIWFGSDKGIVCYDPSTESPKIQPPVLGITSVKINDELIDLTEKIVLSPGNYKIRIDFLGISLKEPALVTYQYKLEGYDQVSEITKDTFITFPRLSEGDYTFILKASSGDGAVSENPLSINIIIKKPVWEKLWFYVIIILFFIILIYIYIKRREYKFLAEKRILEEKVQERTYEIQSQKNEIELQRDEIDEKNANITSSIKYARHIQNAVLPPLELIDKLLPDNFILSKPKDIVSGDFYWLAEKDNKIVFTVADCTGHGVPGAFMGLLGITLLNEIVNIHGITQSDTIINTLRERVILSLKQGRKDIPTTDGMDITLCVLDKDQKKIQYTGGMNDLVYIRNGKLQVLKADRLSVCATDFDTGSFTMKEVDCRKGDVFYLFSDGYRDQFGGVSDKKFLIPHFHLTLLEIHKLPMSNQKEILEEKLKDWMGDTEQTDDITVLGIRL